MADLKADTYSSSYRLNSFHHCQSYHSFTSPSPFASPPPVFAPRFAAAVSTADEGIKWEPDKRLAGVEIPDAGRLPVARGVAVPVETPGAGTSPSGSAR